MIDSGQVKNECILTNDSIFLHANQHIGFVVIYFLVHILLFSAGTQFPAVFLINLIWLFLVKNPFVISFWYQRGIGEVYHSHWSINLGLFRLFCVNGRLFSPIPSLTQQVFIRLDAYRKLTHE